MYSFNWDKYSGYDRMGFSAKFLTWLGRYNTISGIYGLKFIFVSNDNVNYELDFNFYDLQELSDEIFNYVKNLQSKFIFKNSIKELLKNKVINNETYLKYLNNQCDLMYIDVKLREAYKIIGYLSVVLWTLEEGHKQYDFSEDIALFIKEFI